MQLSPLREELVGLSGSLSRSHRQRLWNLMFHNNSNTAKLNKGFCSKHQVAIECHTQLSGCFPIISVNTDDSYSTDLSIVVIIYFNFVQYFICWQHLICDKFYWQGGIPWERWCSELSKHNSIKQQVVWFPLLFQSIWYHLLEARK